LIAPALTVYALTVCAEESSKLKMNKRTAQQKRTLLKDQKRMRQLKFNRFSSISPLTRVKMMKKFHEKTLSGTISKSEELASGG
jgi:hypothetical protein